MDGNFKIFCMLNQFRILLFPIMICLLIIKMFFFQENIQFHQISLIVYFYILLFLYFFISFFILRAIKMHFETTPYTIIKLLAIEFIISILLWLVMFVFIGREFIKNESSIIVLGGAYCIFWVIYFIKSKHIQLYYKSAR